MAPPNANPNVSRLHAAGLVDQATLTQEDITLIEKFSQEEIRMMIQIARKASPDDPRIMKATSPHTGLPKICMPL
jgi:hypothetical protein